MHDSADSLVTKIRAFADGLSLDERSMFAALLAPGILSAYQDDADVEGFGLVDWSPARLPESLTDAIRSHHLRVESDEP